MVRTSFMGTKRPYVSGVLMATLCAVTVSACATDEDDAPDDNGAEALASGVEPGWPPTVSTANPGWMPKDLANSRRSMPATFVTTWFDGTTWQKRQLLSYSNHVDGARDNPATPLQDGRTMQLKWRDFASDDPNAWRPVQRREGDRLVGNLHDTEPGAYATFANIHEMKDANRTLVTFGNATLNGRYTMLRFESSDHGLSWRVSYPRIASLFDGMTPGIFHQGTTAVDIDGVETLLLPMYFFNERTYYRPHVAVMRSTDGGHTWSAHGVIATVNQRCPGLENVAHTVVRPNFPIPPGEDIQLGNGFSETTIAPTRSGKLLAVTRCDQWFLTATDPAEHVRSYLYKSVSSDKGVHWSPLTRIDVPNTAPGDAQLPIYGVSPKLVPMAGGALMLAFGRPGNILAFDSTGEGSHWETIAGWPKSKRWDNTPSVPNGEDGVADEGHLWAHRGSSGYMGIAKLSEYQFMVVGDNCQADWGCYAFTPANAVFPHKKDYLLWNLLVTYVPR